MIEENNNKKKKLRYLIIILVLIGIVTISTYTYFTNSLNSALKRALKTFELASINSTPLTEGVELNIAFILQNPTAYSITIDTIAISFEIDNIDIGGKDINPNSTISARGSSYFYFIRHVTDGTVLKSLENETYKFSVTEGSWISGSTKFLIIQTHATKSIVGSEIIQNA
jgi:LEA14-like dessication related protein